MASKVGDSCVIPKSADVSLHKKKNKLFAQVNLDKQFIFYAESGGFASENLFERIVRACRRDKSPRLMGAEGSQYPNK